MLPEVPGTNISGPRSQGRADPPDQVVIEHCPVCHEGRTDDSAIKLHNLRCSQTGERAYPERETPEYRPPRLARRA